MIRRAWNATTTEGPSRDRFANGLAARVSNECEPHCDHSPELVDGWLEIADRMFVAAGEPMDAAAVDAAVEAADLSDLWEYQTA